MENSDIANVGKRISLLRKSLGVQHQVEMAKMLDIDQKRYHVWEVGKGLIPISYAIKLRLLTGATLDYIYLGEMDGLSSNLIKKISSM